VSFINPRTNKPYPVPTRAAMERAKAHKAMAAHLFRMKEQASGSPAAYLSVIRGECMRQDMMVRRFREHYGPNAVGI
jgi:hypothetical protein